LGGSSFPGTTKVPGEGQQPPATQQRDRGPGLDTQPSALYCIYPVRTKAVFLKQLCIDPAASQELQNPSPHPPKKRRPPPHHKNYRSRAGEQPGSRSPSPPVPACHRAERSLGGVTRLQQPQQIPPR